MIKAFKLIKAKAIDGKVNLRGVVRSPRQLLVITILLLAAGIALIIKALLVQFKL